MLELITLGTNIRAGGSQQRNSLIPSSRLSAIRSSVVAVLRPHDAVQVQYEMLRRVSVGRVSVTEASDEYGVSRPTYYQAQANLTVMLE